MFEIKTLLPCREERGERREEEKRPVGPDGSSLARMDADCYLVLGVARVKPERGGAGVGSACLRH